MASKPLALVTGAAHRLGKALATALARDGYAVGLHYWTSQVEAETAARELSALGAPVFPIRADLSNPDSIPRLFSQLDEIPHPLKVLVNSAGIFRGSHPRDTGLEEWNLTMDLNLRAPFFCAQQAAARMSAGGLIINVTDVAARKAWSHFPAYAASKAALEALTGILARAYAPEIRVNAIAPGLFLRSHDTTEQDWQRLIAHLPLGRTGKTEELSAAFRFLLQNNYVTGQTLVIDGGYALVE